MDIFVKCPIVRSLTVFIALFAFIISANAQPASPDSEPLWIDQTMDEVVAPLKKWLDSDPDQPAEDTKTAQAHSIRSAIKQALKQHQGVVLNADRSDSHYHIKILSKSGTIKVIDIQHSALGDTP